MKLKTILCSMAAATMIVPAVTSCQNEEPVKNPVESGVNLSKGEVFSLSIGIPEDGMKTRSGNQDPTLSYGTDGLFSFDRTIDHLWYAVYNKGRLLYNSTQPGITQANYDATSKGFTLDILVPEIDGSINLEDYSIFFFAGNEADKVDTKEITDGIGLDFANKTLYAYPTMLNSTVSNGDIYDPRQYDYFCKYESLDKVVANVTGADFKGSVVLTRPFCQVTLLTDELRQGVILNTYSDNGKVGVNSVPSIFTQTGETTAKTLPYGWNYGTDQILTKDVTSLAFSLNANALYEKGTTAPQEVTFKDRQMYCVASYLMLAPDSKKAYADGATSQKFSFSLKVTGNLFSTDAFADANIPAAGLRANEKYVLYNRKYTPSGGDTGETDPDDPNPNPNPGGGGDGGILSNHYDIEIIVDPDWQGNNNLVYPK